MEKNILAALNVSIFLVLLSPAAFAFEGPLQVKNQFPLFVHINPPYLERANTEDSFSVSLAHSSVFMTRSSPAWSVQLDMEITEFNFRYRKNIGSLFEFGIEAPVLIPNSGFMDNFLSSYHAAFGFPDYGRSGRPNNEFLYEIRKNGTLVVKGENGKANIGDIRLTAKKMVLSNDPAISLKADIEFPTGDASSGFGSGSIDAGIAVIIDKKINDWLKTYYNVGMVLPGNLKGFETVKLREFVYGGACAEAALSKSLSLLGQVFIQGSPLPKTDIPSIDGTAVLLTFGGRYSSGSTIMEFSFTEDPNTSGAADFTIDFTFKVRY